jgi:sugar lactone lactonase YvrE
MTTSGTDTVRRAFQIDSVGGESPYWDVAAGEFWWLDIHGQRINRGLASGAVESTPRAGPPS